MPQTVAPARRSGTFIGSVNLGARLLDRSASLVQIVVIAAAFGASSRADLYFIAAIVPLTIGSVVGEPLGRGFVTLLLQAEGRGRAVAVAAAGFLACTAVLLVLTAVYASAALLIVRLVGPAGTTSYGAWLVFAAVAPSLGLSGYLGGLLLWLESYTLQAFLTPIGSLIGLVLLIPATVFSDRVVWAAAAIAAGYGVTFAVALVVVFRKLGGAWLMAADRGALRTVLAARRSLSAPVLGGFVGNQVIVMIERILAATIGPGSVSTLSYARGVAAAPATISQAVGAGAYPGIVRADSAGSMGTVRASFLVGLRLNLFLGSVFSIYVALYAAPLMAFLLQRGAFGALSVARTGNALAAFALSTLATSVLMYVVAVLYGIGDFSGILYRSLAVFGAYLLIAPVLLAVYGATGLAFAFSVAQTVGAVLAVTLVARRLSLTLREMLNETVKPVVSRVAVIALVMGIYRVGTSLSNVPVEARGIVNVGGSSILLAIVSSTALLSASLPEAQRLRQLARRGLRRPVAR